MSFLKSGNLCYLIVKMYCELSFKEHRFTRALNDKAHKSVIYQHVGFEYRYVCDHLAVVQGSHEIFDALHIDRVFNFAVYFDGRPDDHAIRELHEAFHISSVDSASDVQSGLSTFFLIDFRVCYRRRGTSGKACQDNAIRTSFNGFVDKIVDRLLDNGAGMFDIDVSKHADIRAQSAFFAH